MISQFSVFKRTDEAQGPKYIINTGDIHNVLSKFNSAQSNVVKTIIQNSSNNSFFLFEYPFNLNIENESIKKCKNGAALYVTKLENPVFLFDFAGLHNKGNSNVDYRSYTLIFNIVGNLVQDFINSKTTGIRELAITFNDIAQLMISAFNKIEADYDELKLISQASTTPNSIKVIIDAYLNFFDQCSTKFHEDRIFAEKLAQINEDMIGYLIGEFGKYKNYESDFIVNCLVNNNLTVAKEFGCFAGQNYLQKIFVGFINIVELVVLKEIINNFDKEKIFSFTGAFHANNINDLLQKCGYEKIYENISTSVEICNQLTAKGVNVLDCDVPELIPVPAELLQCLAEDELTSDLFKNRLSNIEALNAKNISKISFVSWVKKVFKFWNL